MPLSRMVLLVFFTFTYFYELLIEQLKLNVIKTNKLIIILFIKRKTIKNN